MEEIKHLTLIVKAGVRWCFDGDEEIKIKAWLENLVTDMGMNIMDGPFCTYLERKGLKGWTATIHIETSHIVIHSWEEKYPVRIDLHVYTCGKMNVPVIRKALDVFEIINDQFEYILLDIEDEFKILPIEFEQ